VQGDWKNEKKENLYHLKKRTWLRGRRGRKKHRRHSRGDFQKRTREKA